MPNMKSWSIRLLILALIAGTCFAQEVATRKYYKLEFVLKEVEGGKVLNARSFLATTTADPSGNVSIRMSSRVPAGSSSLEVGVNIDCKDAREIQGELFLYVSADITTVIPPQESTAGTQPVLRFNRWSGTVIVPLKKPTVLFASDDIATKRQVQLELTATPIVK